MPSVGASSDFSAAISSPASRPLLPVPDYRLRLFAQGVADRLRDAFAAGETAQEIFTAIRTERWALVHALDSEPFRAAFAQNYQLHYGALMPALPTPSLESCRALTDEVADHRINDARSLAALVEAPSFMAHVRALAQAPKNEQPYQLPPEKIAEMIERFSNDAPPLDADAKIHVQQSMDGHRVGHQALAQTYAAAGNLHTVLQQQLAQQLPAETATRLSADWLSAREKPALATVEMLGETGLVRQQVMARTEAAQPKPARQGTFVERARASRETLLLDRI